jgi:hypothetical protein
MRKIAYKMTIKRNRIYVSFMYDFTELGMRNEVVYVVGRSVVNLSAILI